jgi:iron complex outermembrane receptor protein
VADGTANPTFSIQTGEQRSRGLEFDGVWQSPTGISLLATYTFTAANVVKDTIIPIGNRLANVPRHAGRVWSKYTLPRQRAGTVAVALGATYLGEQQANITNTFAVPSSLVADAGLFWEIGSLGVQLNVVNLFDKGYPLRGAFGNTGIIPGEARRLVLTVKTSLKAAAR